MIDSDGSDNFDIADDMNGSGAARRQWVADCSALLLATGVLTAWPSLAGAQSPGRGEKTVLVVGDSLSAEYGLARGAGWVALLEKAIDEEKLRARVVNASISGDTTSGGRARLAPLLAQHRPAIVVVELGGNDALRGLPVEQTRGNLAAMAQASRAAGARVVLVGMQLPPNYGRSYGERFAAMYGEVATAEGALLVPFLLKGVADVADAESYFQADRIHPLARAQPIMLGNVWPVLRPLLR